jgi:glycosyltransferase involved in cell wall biosynthesis
MPTTPIAVVIPCYNHSNVLRRTLEALTLQTFPAKEVLVIDDGSTDNPEMIVKDFLGRLPLRLIRFEANKGAPAARNEGARNTTSTFLLFLDADAVLVPNALKMMAKELEGDPKAAFVYSDFLWGSKRFRGQKFSLAALNHRNFIHTSSLIRRSAFPGFDESLRKFQDWDLWLTVAERGGYGIWIDQDLYRIEPRAQGMSRWMPRIAYRIPWQKLGFQPKEIGRYREAEAIVRKKHSI